MEDQLISYETAVLAKEMGFKIPCIDYYCKVKSNGKHRLTTGCEYDSDRDVEWDWNNNSESGIAAPYPNTEYKYQYSAPTQTTLQTWLRDIIGVMVWVDPTYYDGWLFKCNVAFPNGDYKVVGIEDGTWVQQLEEGLKIGLEGFKDYKK